MFDSLKSKLKGIFRKTPKEAVLPELQEGETTAVQPAQPAPSRKEAARIAKQQKKEAKALAKELPVAADSGKKIKEGFLDDLLWELEVALMEADVALPVVEEIKDGVRSGLVGKKYHRDHTLDEVVEFAVKDAVRDVLKINEFDFDDWFSKQQRPVSIMFVGINGTGKTTAIAKIANRLMKEGHTVVLAAGDTFRAGAIEQLTIHADRLGCKIVKHSQNADPAAVAFDAIDHAKSKHRDAVLIDTAGRMQTNSNLIDEMKKIDRVAKPAQIGRAHV